MMGKKEKNFRKPRMTKWEMKMKGIKPKSSK